MSVEKFRPSFKDGALKHQQKPYSQILNHPVQNCGDLELIGLWTYLQTLPENWTVRIAQIRSLFGIGKDKAHALFAQLIKLKLLDKNVTRDEKGYFKSTDYIVLNGESYEPENKQNDQKEVNAHPFPDYPEPDYPEPVNPPHINKIDIINKNITKKEIEDIYCANDENLTIDQFDNFWESYPRKKDKDRTKKIWMAKGLNKICDSIIQDVHERLSKDSQWKDPQYIPHPSTYLRNKLWEDEITISKPKKSHGEDHPVTKSINKLKEQCPEFLDFLLS